MFSEKKILIGISGSIAAYKTISLIRLLVKGGAEVKVVMTPSAKDFITPLTLSTISKNEVLVDLFNERSWANHVALGRWADIMLIAPLSCNTLAKMANGFCDNLLLAVYLSATCPVIAAPAMDEDMWQHTSTKINIEKIISFGNKIIPVENGELASGLYGEGRMAEPETIIKYLKDFFFETNELAGIRVLITAGPTQEALDPVRFISNYSSGKMGVAIAEEFIRRGASVTLVLGPTQLSVNCKVNIVNVVSAEQMKEAAMQYFSDADIIVMAAAVADYTPEDFSLQKMKKKDNNFTISLKKTEDILKAIGELKKEYQILVGFALETENETQNALSKLKEKKADMIILNSLRDEDAGFGKDTNKITIFDKHGNQINFKTKPKKEVATDIVNTIIQFKNV